MRQISEGEFCGECPCTDDDFSDTCYLYSQRLTFDSESRNLRLPQCLRDKPQVLTAIQRKALHAEGYEDCRKDLKEVKP